LPAKIESRVATYLSNVDPTDQKQWPKICIWLQQQLEKLHTVFAERIKNLKLGEINPISEEDDVDVTQHGLKPL
jgi:hypothetical protein